MVLVHKYDDVNKGYAEYHAEREKYIKDAITNYKDSIIETDPVPFGPAAL